MPMTDETRLAKNKRIKEAGQATRAMEEKASKAVFWAESNASLNLHLGL